MTQETLLNTMEDFLLNEPSGDFQLLDDGIHLCEYNGIGEHELKQIAEIANNFDESGNLSLIYLASLCRDQIENTVAPVSLLLNNSSILDKYRECLECINSKDIMESRSEIVGKLASVISSVSEKKVIGNTDAIDSILDELATRQCRCRCATPLQNASFALKSQWTGSTSALSRTPELLTDGLVFS